MRPPTRSPATSPSAPRPPTASALRHRRPSPASTATTRPASSTTARDGWIRARYHRSLDLPLDAIRLSSRACVFDNSSKDPTWLAEITDGKVVELKSAEVPKWFQRAVLEKIGYIPPPLSG